MKKIMKKLLIIVMIIGILTQPSSVFAITSEEVGNIVSNFAVAFGNDGESKDMLRYSCYNVDDNTGEYAEFMGYNLQLSTVSGGSKVDGPWSNKLAFDCSSFVLFCYHYALGLDIPGNPDMGMFANSGYFDVYSGDPPDGLKKGDLIYTNNVHVAMYIGDGQIAEFGHFNVAPVTGGYHKGNWYSQVARLNQNGINNIGEIKTSFNWSDGSITSWGTDGVEKEENTPKWQYEGLPKPGEVTGTYTLKRSLEWVISRLSQVADYIIGIILMVFKIPIVGLTTMFENMVTDTVDKVTNSNATGEEIKIDPDGAKATGTDDVVKATVPERITVESIVYNLVPILDVNLFDFENPGGMPMDEDSVLYVIRDTLAGWYYVIRNLAIIGMLLVLLYLGIKLALSASAEKTGDYKKLLTSWVVGFIIIFAIQYFMFIVLTLNEAFIDTIQKAVGPTGAETSIYETARTRAYDIKASSAVIGTVMYIILVYYMVKFLYIYFKRFIVVCILTIEAPAMGAVYAFEKVKTGKSKAFGGWAKDFAFNVLIQTVHCLIYVIFAPMILSLAFTDFGGLVLAVAMLKFLTEAQKIAEKMLRMEGASSLSDTLRTTGGMLGMVAAFAIAKKGFDYAGTGIQKTTEFGRNIYHRTGRYQAKQNALYGAPRDTEPMSDINKKISNMEKTERNLHRQYRKEATGFATKFATGIGTGVLGLTALTKEGGVSKGGLALVGSHQMIKEAFESGRIGNKPHKYDKPKRFQKARTALNVATLGTSSKFGKLYTNFKDSKEYLQEDVQKQKELLHRAKNKEIDVVEEAQKLKVNGSIIFKDTKNPIELRLSDKYEGMLRHNINQALGTISSKDVIKAIEKYMKDKDINSLATTDFNDIGKIINDINLRKDASDKTRTDLTVTNQIGQNIREELRDNIMKEVMGEQTKYNLDINDNVKTNVNNILTSSDDDATKERELNKVLDEHIDRKVMPNLNVKELTALTGDALREESSLRRDVVIDDFKPLVEKAKELQKVNDEYKELTGKEIYKVEDIVNNIITLNQPLREP